MILVRQGLLTSTQRRETYASVLWTHVDVRDAAAGCRLAMERNLQGHVAFYIAAPRILSEDPVEELLVRYFPGDCPVAAHIRGTASPIDYDKPGVC